MLVYSSAVNIRRFYTESILRPDVMAVTTARISKRAATFHPLKVVVIVDNPLSRSQLAAILAELGHDAAAADWATCDVGELGRSREMELLLFGIGREELGGLEAFSEGFGSLPFPAIAISDVADPNLVQWAAERGVQACLIQPVNTANLQAAISISRAQFNELQAARREAARLRQALADRKIIERAKGILMKHASLDEQQAHRRLQVLATQRSIKLVTVAQMIVASQSVLEP